MLVSVGMQLFTNHMTCPHFQAIVSLRSFANPGMQIGLWEWTMPWWHDVTSTTEEVFCSCSQFYARYQSQSPWPLAECLYLKWVLTIFRRINHVTSRFEKFSALLYALNTHILYLIQHPADPEVKVSNNYRASPILAILLNVDTSRTLGPCW